MGKGKDLSRREFIKNTALTGAGFAAMPFSIVKGQDKSKVRIGMIGVGGRGTSHLKGLLKRPDVDIPAVCDVRKEHAENAKKLIVQSGREAPDLYTGGEEIYETRSYSPNNALPVPVQTPESRNTYKRLIARDDLDAVLIATPWRFHTPIAIDAMKAGKFVGVEVPAAYTVDDCWDLVNTSEKTGMPCMMLENVCYRRDVMAILNMVREGLFGEMIHARCGYQDDLRAPGRGLLNNRGQFGPSKKPKGRGSGEQIWRSYQNLKRNGDLYPTHGIGPVAEWLDINHGNRFLKLTSTATKARSLHKTIVERAGNDVPNAKLRFNKGDIVTSTIKTAKGQSIIVTLDVTLPRPYSLNFRCQGLNGLWLNPARGIESSIYLEDKSPHTDEWESFEPYQKKYDAPIYKKHKKMAEGSGHGGMDWFIRNAFVESIKGNIYPPIDVYDAAAWSAIGPLSEESIARGGAPVDFPDFTDGQWLHNGRIFNID